MEDRTELLIRAAELYYEEGMNQNSIATLLKTSRPTVSRLLDEAKETGVVEIIVHDPIRKDPKLSYALRTKLNLRDAVVVTGAYDYPKALQRCCEAGLQLFNSIMAIFDVGDATEIEGVLDLAYNYNGPVYIRMLRKEVPRFFPANEPIQFNHARVLSEGSDVTILSSSICTEEAMARRKNRYRKTTSRIWESIEAGVAAVGIRPVSRSASPVAAMMDRMDFTTPVILTDRSVTRARRPKLRIKFRIFVK